MATGTVKWYDPDQGYGSIVPDGGGADVFVHQAVVVGAGLAPGDRVAFALQGGPNGPIADDVRVTGRAVPAQDPTDERLAVPVHEERLFATTREVRLGDVRIHKRIEAVPVEVAVDLAHDEVSIERLPINRPIASLPDARYEGDTLVVPVVEEVLITEKRLMLREELRITRRRVTEATPIRDVLRREVVEVEGRGAAGVTPIVARIPDRERAQPT